LHRQELGDTPIVSILVRWSGSGLDPQDSAEEITIGFENAVVRIPLYDIWPAVRWHVRAVQQANTSTTLGNSSSTSSSTTKSSSWWGSSSSNSGGGGLINNIAAVAASHGFGHAPQITPTKYYFKKSMGSRTASACVGPAAPSLSSLLARRQDPPHRNVIFTAGADPPFALFVVEESQSGGSLLSLVAGLATSSASELFGRAKSFLPGNSISSNTGGDGKKSSSRPTTPPPLGGGTGVGRANSINSNSLTPQASLNLDSTNTNNKTKREKIPGVTIYQESAVWDEDKRKVSHMALSPCCRWAACCDSLGRVLLVDVCSCVVLKMLKGYREAQAAWFIPTAIENSNKETTNTTACTAPGPTPATTTAALLVVFAPRRGVVELWKPHSGVRVGSISAPVPQRGVLLEQPAVPSSLVNTRGQMQFSSSQSWRSFHSNSCWLLNLETLELVNLTDKLNQLISNNAS
jgi:Rab3 GTPase-activating protein regulatory subunit N-terminus